MHTTQKNQESSVVSKRQCQFLEIVSFNRNSLIRYNSIIYKTKVKKFEKKI